MSEFDLLVKIGHLIGKFRKATGWLVSPISVVAAFVKRTIAPKRYKGAVYYLSVSIIIFAIAAILLLLADYSINSNPWYWLKYSLMVDSGDFGLLLKYPNLALVGFIAFLSATFGIGLFLVAFYVFCRPFTVNARKIRFLRTDKNLIDKSSSERLYKVELNDGGAEVFLQIQRKGILNFDLYTVPEETKRLKRALKMVSKDECKLAGL